VILVTENALLGAVEGVCCVFAVGRVERAIARTPPQMKMKATAMSRLATVAR
jgi:hypothetical protein